MKTIAFITFCLLIEYHSYSQSVKNEPLTKDLIYTINNRHGLVGLNSKILTPPIYFEISRVSEGKYSASKLTESGKKYGYLDEQGKELCPFIYNDAYPYINNYAPVKLAEGWTFIDTNFRSITDKRFSFVKDFSEGFAEVRNANNKWNFIDEKGNFLCQEFFEETGHFAQYYAVIKKDGKYGYIDTSGSIKVQPAFYLWRDFNKFNVAAVAIEDLSWKFVRKNGEVFPKDSVTTVAFPYILDNGLFLVGRTDNNGKLKFGFMNVKDEIAIPIIYDRMEEFFYHTLTSGVIDSVTYLVDEKGKIKLKTDYAFIHYYYKGPVAMVYKKATKNLLSKLKLKISDVSVDIITANGLMGVIDSVGKECVPTIYKDLMPVYSQIYDNFFGTQCLFVATRTNNELLGVIDDHNNILVPFLYDKIHYICKDIFIVKIKDEFSIYKSTSKTLTKFPDYEYLDDTWREFQERYLILKTRKSGLVGLMNNKGDWVIKPQFSKLSFAAKEYKKKE